VPLLLLKGLDSLTNPSCPALGPLQQRLAPAPARPQLVRPMVGRTAHLFRPNGLVKTANGRARKSVCHHDMVRDPVLDGAVVY
jgi:hypothetical protein